MKFFKLEISLLVLILGITVLSSLNLVKSKSLTQSKIHRLLTNSTEYLPHSCRGGPANITIDLNFGLSNLSPNNWETNEFRKPFYTKKCGCPGITAYSDNSKLPFNYMQCCLRYDKECTFAQHPAIHTVINLASSELASSTCTGTANWGNKSKITQENFVYRGQDTFYGPNGQLSSSELSLLIRQGAVWRYKAFTSFSYDLKRSAGYSNKKGSLKNTFIVRIAGNAKLRGLFIENCSLYPQEKEFLVDKNSCFRVSREVTTATTQWKSDGIPENTGEFRFIDLEPINCNEAAGITIRDV